LVAYAAVVGSVRARRSMRYARWWPLVRGSALTSLWSAAVAHVMMLVVSQPPPDRTAAGWLTLRGPGPASLSPRSRPIALMTGGRARPCWCIARSRWRSRY